MLFLVDKLLAVSLEHTLVLSGDFARAVPSSSGSTAPSPGLFLCPALPQHTQAPSLLVGLHFNNTFSAVCDSSSRLQVNPHLQTFSQHCVYPAIALIFFYIDYYLHFISIVYHFIILH